MLWVQSTKELKKKHTKKHKNTHLYFNQTIQSSRKSSRGRPLFQARNTQIIILYIYIYTQHKQTMRGTKFDLLLCQPVMMLSLGRARARSTIESIREQEGDVTKKIEGGERMATNSDLCWPWWVEAGRHGESRTWDGAELGGKERSGCVPLIVGFGSGCL